MFIPLSIGVTILFCSPARLLSQDQNKALQPAKILGVDAHPEGRIVYWTNADTTPTYDGYPYYDISVQLGGDCYVSRYESHTGYYPADWKPGSTVQARMGGGVIYLVRYDGAEVPTRVQVRCSPQD